MPMPQYEFMLIFVVVVVAIALRRVVAALVRETKRAQETGQAYRRSHAPAPAPFQEAAPIHPLMKARKEPEAPAPAPAAMQRGQTKITREELELERDKRAAERRVATTAKAAAPRPSVMPQFSGASLVQAVITKEILTRPPAAVRPYKGWNRRQSL